MTTICILGLVSCSQRSSSGPRTTLGIRTPEVSSLSAMTALADTSSPYTNSGLWGLETPVSISEIDCFGIAAVYPEGEGNSCHLLSGEVVKIDEIFGSVKAGDLLQADISSGDQRRIQVIGFATIDGSCPSDLSNLSKNQMQVSSAPMVLGETVVDVEGESMEVEIVISMNGALAVNDCTGESFAWEEGMPESTIFNVDNGNLTLMGANLGSVHSARIVDSNGVATELSVQSKNSNGLALKALSALELAASSVYQLFISNAYGQQVFSITVSGSGSGLPGGALIGQVLKFDGSNWVPGDLGALSYSGTWDASSATEPNAAPAAGEYYIVDTAGVSIDLSDGLGPRNWSVGDWIVWNDTDSQWDQVSNGNSVASFNSRSGVVLPAANDYTWAQIDKSVSALNDIADVSASVPTTGDILVYNGTNWASQPPSSDPQVSINASNISANTSNIASNTSALAAKENSITTGTAAQYFRGDKTWAVLDAAAVGLSNVSDVAQIPLSSLDATVSLGVSDSLVPTQNAVKTYVDNQLALKLDSAGGSLTGNLNVNGNITYTGTISGDGGGLSNVFAMNSSMVWGQSGGPSAPPIAFSADTDTGFFQATDGSDKIDISNGGAHRFSFGVNGFAASVADGALISPNAGSSTVPSYSFLGDEDTGFFSDAPDVIGVTLGGIAVFNFDAGRLISPAAMGGVVRSNTGSASTPTFSFATNEATGMYSPSTNDLSLVTGGSDRLFINASGMVGIGTNAPAYNLHVNGSAGGTSAYTNVSDRRYKQDFQAINHDGYSAIEKISMLEGLYFTWRQDEFPNKKFQKGRDLGVVAQNVEEVFPEAVMTGGDGFKSVAYSKLVAPLIEAVKELFSKGESDKDELKRELASVKEENALMKTYLCEKDKSAPFCP